MLLGESMNGMCSSRSHTAPALLPYKKRGTVQPNDPHRQERGRSTSPEAMEGRKNERVKAAAVCVLVILLSAQRLPIGVADPTSAFCQCYLGCFDLDCSRKGWQRCHDYCCAQVCHLPGDADFDLECRGGYHACTESTGDGE